MIPTTSNPEAQAAARRQLVRLLAERLVRDALAESTQPGATDSPKPAAETDASDAVDGKGGAA